MYSTNTDKKTLYMLTVVKSVVERCLQGPEAALYHSNLLLECSLIPHYTTIQSIQLLYVSAITSQPGCSSNPEIKRTI